MWIKKIMKTLIKNERIVTTVDNYRADILIEDETISFIHTEMILNSTTDNVDELVAALDKGFSVIQG